MSELREVIWEGRQMSLAVAIEQRHPLSVFNIRVYVSDGVAIIRGAVGSDAAKRFAFEIVKAQPSVHDVINHLEITAVLEPANRVENTSTLQGIDTIIRYPAIRVGSDVVPGEWLDITVDLDLTPDHSTDGSEFKIDDAPAGWEQLPVQVTLVSDLLEFEGEGDDCGEIIVRRGRRSRSASFTAKLSGNAADTRKLRISALFFYNGRQSGFGEREFHVATPSGADGVTAPIANLATASQIHPNARAPDLTISIVDDERVGRYTWVWNGGDITGLEGQSCKASVDLGSGAEAFARLKLAQCPTLRPGRHDPVLRGIGSQIWEAVPTAFKQYYHGLRQQKGNQLSIQIVTDDPYVPWEMICPDIYDDHLYMMHPVARWSLRTGRGINLTPGKIFSFVPNYSDDKSLKWAVREGEVIVERYGAVKMPANYDVFHSTLLNGVSDETVSILHFAGHGARESTATSECGLSLEDGWFNLDAVRDQRNMLGRKDRSFVVLNACQVGQTKSTLGILDGWPAALIERGFGGVIAPLWSVEDQAASKTILAIIENLIEHRKPLGEAVRQARADFRTESSTPYPFLCYGDVAAEMQIRPNSPRPQLLPKL